MTWDEFKQHIDMELRNVHANGFCYHVGSIHISPSASSADDLIFEVTHPTFTEPGMPRPTFDISSRD